MLQCHSIHYLLRHPFASEENTKHRRTSRAGSDVTSVVMGVLEGRRC